jgi:two-component system chemotaxis response regulator CheY
MKVLVVDDSGVMRKIIVRALNAVGVVDVVEAGDGLEGFNQFQAETFDLVLTDWNMPVRNGLELVTDIRATGSKVPIMMVTTEAQKSQVILAIQAGVTDYLTKPFENETLRKKLDKYVAV